MPNFAASDFVEYPALCFMESAAKVPSSEDRGDRFNRFAASLLVLLSEHTRRAPAPAIHCRGIMRAIIQDGYGSADVLRLQDIDVPAIGENGVLVRVRAASVNAADCHLLRLPPAFRRIMGLHGPQAAIRGFDVAGHVERVGTRVTRFRPGDEVFGHAPGSFAEFASARDDRLVPMPLGLTFGQAAALPVAGTTALQGLRDKAGVRRGQRVLIHGAGGGVGTFAVQIARYLGAHVTAVTSTRNMDLVRSLGPDDIIDYTREDFSRREQRYDVFLDIAATRSLNDCRRVLAPGGTLVIAGAPKGGSLAAIARMLSVIVVSRFVSQRIVSFMGKVRQDDLLVLKALAEAGRVVPLIDRAYSLSEVPDAMRYVASGRARAKVIITVEG